MNSAEDNKRRKSVQEIFAPLELRLLNFQNRFYISEVYERWEVHNKYLDKIKEDVLYADYIEAIAKIDDIIAEINNLLQDDNLIKKVLKKSMVYDVDNVMELLPDEELFRIIMDELSLNIEVLEHIKELLSKKQDSMLSTKPFNKIATKFTVAELALILKLLSEDTDYLQIPDKVRGITKASVIRMISNSFTSKRDGTKEISTGAFSNNMSGITAPTAQSVNSILENLIKINKKKYL